MSEEDVSKELAENELEEISGGREYAVKTDRGVEYWYACSGCREYKELIYSGNGGVKTHLQGTITCPKCGFTGSFSVHIG